MVYLKRKGVKKVGYTQTVGLGKHAHSGVLSDLSGGDDMLYVCHHK